MIDFILYTAGLYLAFHLLTRWLSRPRMEYPSAEEVAELALRKTAEDLEMDVEELRMLLKQAARDESPRTPILRVVK